MVLGGHVNRLSSFNRVNVQRLAGGTACWWTLQVDLVCFVYSHGRLTQVVEEKNKTRNVFSWCPGQGRSSQAAVRLL